MWIEIDELCRRDILPLFKKAAYLQKVYREIEEKMRMAIKEREKL